MITGLMLAVIGFVLLFVPVAAVKLIGIVLIVAGAVIFVVGLVQAVTASRRIP